MRRYERQRRRKYRKEEWHFVVCLATLSTCTLRKILGKWMTLEKKTGFLEWQFTGETTKSAFSTDILCTTNHTCRQLAFWDCGFESHRMHGCLSILLCVVKLKSLWRADHSPRGVLPTVVRRCVWSRNLVNEETLAHLDNVAPIKQNICKILLFKRDLNLRVTILRGHCVLCIGRKWAKSYNIYFYAEITYYSHVIFWCSTYVRSRQL